ncbi:13957_t:CDS:2 [Acaulospora colombiana]|uniref:13957_t:CDS:1 n=1 Tax=Acaulospora colombiana TaxID=27376 RepID=A0ACA9PVY3_9GLOM|nr:13957_t:CDS:2 [Acaulospora colombiana]
MRENIDSLKLRWLYRVAKSFPFAPSDGQWGGYTLTTLGARRLLSQDRRMPKQRTVYSENMAMFGIVVRVTSILGDEVGPPLVQMARKRVVSERAELLMMAHPGKRKGVNVVHLAAFSSSLFDN